MVVTVLVGDIGGTNARFAVLERHDDGLELLREGTVKSGSFPSLGDALGSFLDSSSVAREFDRAGFGIAGPVRENRCEATNLPWVVDGDVLARRLDLPGVTLLNDVEAAAWGLNHLAPNGVREIKEGRVGMGQGNRAILAPGTGLGEAVLLWDGERHHPFATEAGHADFAPADELQVELWRYLHRRHGHVSWERVASGPGLVSLFRFFLDRAGEEEPEWLEAELRQGDAAASISARAHDGECSLCRESLDLFFSVLGAEAGNLALRTLATGGVFLAGGIVPKLLPDLLESSFLASFVAKGRFRPLLESIPVHVVVDDRLGLWGAAARVTGLVPPTPQVEAVRR